VGGGNSYMVVWCPLLLQTGLSQETELSVLVLYKSINLSIISFVLDELVLHSLVLVIVYLYMTYTHATPFIVYRL
jgi:hypothetical protein